ncbi:hypothetical protein MSIMFB_01224 [Mycobacterium simulans]|uniref:Uncharacterized protein n=1 Tax=Mycobacterium simulans TaxID=627089 RepID=A0A7Z7IJX7_9MYCO|nr:hypothetical protein MSIMFB_01224 [Mycobacterium simulans]
MRLTNWPLRARFAAALSDMQWLAGTIERPYLRPIRPGRGGSRLTRADNDAEQKSDVGAPPACGGEE